ncbi:hypothetical protein ACSBR1_008895 [Camellia fascicularis]
MLSFDGVGEEVFFDSAEYFLLSSEESVVAKEDLLNGNLEFEVWSKEPQSVKERRDRFLRRMGFVELARASKEESDEMMGLERIVECSGTVSSCYTPQVEENLVCYGRELSCEEANCGFDELEQDQVCNLSVALEGETYRSHVKECKIFDMDKKNLRNWWKKFIKNKRMRTRGTEVLKPICETPKVNRMKVHQKKKKYMELSAVYVGQEIQAHEGFIWSMKFSPNGQYLASGGEDGVIRIWRVMQADASCKEKESIHAQAKFGGRRGKEGKKPSHLSVVVPDKVFQIEELPLQEFHGHTSDVLDLAWSKSNCLLSSSKDKTVRLWQVGCNECISVFQHNDYVTCIQFNPVNENYFMSGSIDGKVRIWGVTGRQVVDWADVRDVVTAICYHPDGKGFIVGCVTGTCRFYGASDGNLQLTTVINFRGRSKSSSNKITGIQFNQDDSQRVMITSEDCKVRILDGTDIVREYRGLAKSGSQLSASFTSTGRHIISVGKDCRVYVWNYDDPCIPSSKQSNSVRSCEHFFLEGVSLAIPWSNTTTTTTQSRERGCSDFCLQMSQDQQHKPSSSSSGRFSLSNWLFSMDVSCGSKGSVTWPEENLPAWDVHTAEHHHHEAASATWGLVIVTAGCDGMIRTFHNYGLPVTT